MLVLMSLCVSLTLLACSRNDVPDENMFEVGNEQLTNIKVNQPFQITGYLNQFHNA